MNEKIQRDGWWENFEESSWNSKQIKKKVGGKLRLKITALTLLLLCILSI